MKINQIPPEMIIYTPDRRRCKGIVVAPQDITVNCNFNALSKITFKVNKRIYNTETYNWEDNLCYDLLTQNTLIRTTGDFKTCRFWGRPQLKYGTISTQTQQYPRTGSNLSFTATIDNAKLQNEVELFDVGNQSGYKWEYYSHMDDSGQLIDSSQNDNYYYNIACKEFFPIQVGDIVALKSRNEKDGDAVFTYRLHFYAEENVQSYLGSTEFTTYNPSNRICINSNHLKNFSLGYLRVEAWANQAQLTSTSWNSYSPAFGYIKIYSGERRCTSVSTAVPEIAYTSENWWVVGSVDEQIDSDNESKIVTLYAYEYVLSQKTLSLPEGTLPLYIPDGIANLVTDANNFIVDSVNGENYRGAQRMIRGLMNQVLDYLPDWDIGYINPDVVVRYRSVENIDNANIYSFLINSVQPLYKCYFVFDTEHKYIHILSQSDIVKINSNAHLTWDNAVKSIQRNNSDSRFVTAMRVHTGTGEHQYQLGLVNPTGNNIIYDFSSVKSELDFVADTTHYKENSEDCYTLREVVDRFELSISNYTESYRKSGRKLVEAILNKEKTRIKLHECLEEYQSTADTINIYLKDDYPEENVDSMLIPEKPMSSASMRSGGSNAPTSQYIEYHSKSLYQRLLSLAEAYEQCYDKWVECNTLVDNLEKELRSVALVHSLNYKTLQSEYERCGNEYPYLPIFTPLEAKALSYYIYEGDWTDENAVFSETYSADDIISTLETVYDNAEEELENIYCKPTHEYSLSLANITAIPELSVLVDNIYLGNSVFVVNKSDLVKPVLLSIHIDYSNPENFSMQLSTDYKRKPLELRFSDLFGTISQVSVETPTFTFDK